MLVKLISKSSSSTYYLGRIIGSLVKMGDVFCLDGNLGAGKTKLAQGFGEGLGVDDIINSPTFTLINEYKGRLTYYHMDVYRLEGYEEMFDLGYEEYFYGNGIVLIEWSKNVEEILPKERLDIEIKRGEEENQRIILLNPLGERYEKLLQEIIKFKKELMEKGVELFVGAGD